MQIEYYRLQWNTLPDLLNRPKEEAQTSQMLQ